MPVGFLVVPFGLAIAWGWLMQKTGTCGDRPLPSRKTNPRSRETSGSRATVLWVYRKMRNGQPWHLRGVDVFAVRDGKVAAKLAYVKG